MVVCWAPADVQARTDAARAMNVVAVFMADLVEWRLF